MFRYELKNKMKMAAFIAALPGFMEALQRAGQTGTFDNVYYCVGSIHTEKINAPGEWRVNIPADEVEAFELYNPNRWNNYPAVKPPEGVLMRIEGQYAKRPELEYYGALMYLEGAWHFADTVEIADNVIVERFRPWDEETTK